MQILVNEQNLMSNLTAQKSTTTATTTTATATTTTTTLNEKNKPAMKIAEQIQKLLKSVEMDDNKENVKQQQKILNIESGHTQIYTHTPFPGISQLLPSLFLCGAGAAMPQVLDKLNVNFVINVAPELPDTPLSGNTNPLYLRINAQDRPLENLAQHFDEVADMIEEVRQNGGKSLVHCVAGVSRSASLCLAYLMKHEKMTLREAYFHVKAIRPQIRPNSGFFQQLRDYEEKLFGCCTIKMVFIESINKEIPDVLEPEYKAMEDFYQRQRNALKQRLADKQQQQQQQNQQHQEQKQTETACEN